MSSYSPAGSSSGELDFIQVEIDQTWDYYSDWVRRPGGGRNKISPVFMNLEDIDEHCAPNWADSGDILGRPESFKSYAGTSNREVSLMFQFRAQGNQGPSQSDTGALQSEVYSKALWLEALKYPLQASDGLSHAPPPLVLIVGQLLVMRCIATSVEVKWVSPFDPVTMYAYGADVTVGFTAVSKRLGNFDIATPFRVGTNVPNQ